MSGRPKGYMDWNPSPDVREVVHQVVGVLDEYSEHGPMTVRQVFYRLVGQHGYPKDERAYKRLGEYVVKARRAQMIGFGRIRDDGTTSLGGGGYDSAADVYSLWRSDASSLRLNRQRDQAQRIELWCEAAGMAPMLAGMVREWSVPVYSTGGFSSVTVTHEVAQRVREDEDRPTVFLHVGDYDPSGESIFSSMSQDIGAFIAGTEGGRWNSTTGELRGRFEPVRVALTEAQVARYNLPTAPPKRSDSRSAAWVGETTQAEALPPDLLRDIVREAVFEYIDEDILGAVLEEEAAERAKAVATIDKLLAA